jgi:hypothetical protein
MSPTLLVISTTYKTRVALEKPCKERLGIVIGQLKDRRVSYLLNPLRFGLLLRPTRPAADHHYYSVGHIPMKQTSGQ